MLLDMGVEIPEYSGMWNVCWSNRGISNSLTRTAGGNGVTGVCVCMCVCMLRQQVMGATWHWNWNGIHLMLKQQLGVFVFWKIFCFVSSRRRVLWISCSCETFSVSETWLWPVIVAFIFYSFWWPVVWLVDVVFRCFCAVETFEILCYIPTVKTAVTWWWVLWLGLSAVFRSSTRSTSGFVFVI